MKESIEFISIKEALPKHPIVYIKTADNRVRKGMFYMNGGTPVFASYGSPVEDVTHWAYRND